MTVPLKPLTPTERRVAALMATGVDYGRIGLTLHMADATVAVHVTRIAAKLPNPDDLTPRMLVSLWAAHEHWLAQRHVSAA